MAKVQLPKLISPVAVAAYAWLDKPDSKFAKTEDEANYKLTLVFDEDDAEAQAFVQKISDLGQEIAPKLKDPVKLKKGFKLVKESDKDEFEGKILLECKSKYKPTLIDSARNELGDGAIKSGDLVRASILVKPYPAFGSGISLKLRAVQLIEKRNMGGGGGADDFDDYEGGYVADQTSGGSGEDDDDDADF